MAVQKGSLEVSASRLPTLGVRLVVAREISETFDNGIITNMSKDKACGFCGIGAQRELELGALHTLAGVSVHCFCLFFSSGLAQNGEEEEGILGFLIPDIQREIARGKNYIWKKGIDDDDGQIQTIAEVLPHQLGARCVKNNLPCIDVLSFQSCAYCGKKGATIGCSEKKCRRSYHYACGLNHNCLYRFSGDFRSYCQKHRTYQQGIAIGQKVECPICMDELIADPKKAVWSPCCNRKWFHKICIQQLAVSAGYFFKCPLCNDKEVFVEEMQNFGIYVPEKDASWELEPNAYIELERPVRCDAPKCFCPDGRKRDDIGTRWEILLCSLCGASGIHITCGKLRFTCTEWTCPTCIEMLEESKKRANQEVRERRLVERNKRVGTEISENETDAKRTASCSAEVVYETPSNVDMEEAAEDFSTPDKSCYLTKTQSKEGSFTILSQSGIAETSELSSSTDSEEEIVVDLGEYQVPPHTIIRELEENGGELSKKLKKLKNYALRAQERMIELRLTEAEIVKMVRESSFHKDFTLDKATVMTFFSCSLPLDKMVQMSKIIRAIYSVREAVILTAQSAKTKPRRFTRKARRKMRRPCPNTPNIKVTLCRSLLSKTLCQCGSDCRTTSTGESFCKKACDVDMSQDVTKHNEELEAFNSPICNKSWNSLLDSPNSELKLSLTLSPDEKTPVYLKHMRSTTSYEVTPPAIRLSNGMDKENDMEELSNIKGELEIYPGTGKRPLEESITSYQDNIMANESSSFGAGTSSQPFQDGSGLESLKVVPLPSGTSSHTNIRSRTKGSKTRKKLSLDYKTPKRELLNLEQDVRSEEEINNSTDVTFDQPSSGTTCKKKKLHSHDSHKYVQKTLISYFVKSLDGETKCDSSL
ncbi:uncharacterized protein LOC135204004 [Macrobrachium nipponense]|uniref:uncharacterized protein LOC135204004 n=1 Tax=Macrobrachium nipponense TaxID=159736 RepID=UPI0030C87BAC